jgi:hypothetical protein
MLRGWLLPESSYAVLREGWDRAAYRPKHGKPPLLVRAGQAVASAAAVARERYRGAAEEDTMTSAPRPAS